MKYSEAKPGMFISVKFDSPAGLWALSANDVPDDGSGRIEQRRAYLLLKEVRKDGFSSLDLSTGRMRTFSRERALGGLTGRFQESTGELSTVRSWGWVEMKPVEEDVVRHIITSARDKLQRKKIELDEACTLFETGASVISQFLSPARASA